MENVKSGKELQEMLTYSVKHIAKRDRDAVEKSFEFCEGYKDFLSRSKTERLAAANILEIAKANGYTQYDSAKVYSAGDKVYLNNRDKSVILATIGTNTLDKGVSIVASHIDCPRLDLKPNPMYENNEIGYFKTHYYGGVKRYQWAAMPLAIHGVAVKTNGEKVEIHIGEDPADPVFCLTDLLPHLSKDQAERKMRDVIKGEEMNVVISSLPYRDDEVKEAVKLTALALMYEKYSITEREFINAELEVVPAGGARDVGFDRSLIGAYGHDDRVCAYTSLMAEIEADAPAYTTVSVYADKEEVGSDGVTGMHSDFLEHFIIHLAQMQNVDPLMVLRNSKCLSADVNAAYDPLYKSVMDKRNASQFGFGVVFCKFTGSRGKSGSNDANAEYIAELRKIMDDANVAFQISELGKVDIGGGGTIAYILANYNVEVIDCGVGVLSMHAPWEVTSKSDIYEAYRGYIAFLQNA